MVRKVQTPHHISVITQEYSRTSSDTAGTIQAISK